MSKRTLRHDPVIDGNVAGCGYGIGYVADVVIILGEQMSDTSADVSNSLDVHKLLYVYVVQNDTVVYVGCNRTVTYVIPVTGIERIRDRRGDQNVGNIQIDDLTGNVAEQAELHALIIERSSDGHVLDRIAVTVKISVEIAGGDPAVRNA